MLTINNTVEGYLKDVEIKGNTWQDSENLADIRSVGTKVEGQELYEIPVLSCGKNLIDTKNYSTSTGININNIGLKEGVKYTVTTPNVTNIKISTYREGVGESLLTNIKNNFLTFIYNSNKPWKLFVWKDSSWVDYVNENVEIQLEEGTQSTPYEPYQEDKLTILSPTPLEKVGDIADKIVCKDGVYGVEKNVGTLVLNENSNVTDISTSGINCDYLTVKYPNGHNLIYQELQINFDTINSYGLKNLWNTHDSKHYYIEKHGIRVYTDKGLYSDTKSAKEYLKQNNLIIKAPLIQPTFIPLPHDQQIKLRTFANKTNISFLTEIEPTLKAQVPKSLGATVNTHTSQIDNLNKELDRVKKLEESTVSTVTTDSSFTTVAETTQGYFEGVKLEGRTLVNLGGKVQDTYNMYAVLKRSLRNLMPSSKYTFILKNNTDYDLSFYANEKVFTDANWVTVKANSSLTKIYTTLSTDITEDILIKSASKNSTVFDLDVVVLEGDHTDKDLNFFEGLKSVGQDSDEISVLSVNNGKLDLNIVYNNYYFNSPWANGNAIAKISSSNARTTNKIKVYPNCKYYVNAIGGNRGVVNFFKNERDELPYNGIKLSPNDDAVGTFITDSECNYIQVYVASGVEVSEFILNFGDKQNNFNYKQDKKQILYYNPNTQTWEKPVLREWDSIEKHGDGKYYYHKRSGEVVLNGAEGWYIVRTNANHSIFTYKISDALRKPDYCAITNRFAQVPNTVESLAREEEFFLTDIAGGINISIENSKLSQTNVDGFKQWLQTNNVTVVYQLAQEEVYECTNLDLITYNGVTNLIVNSGAIQPKLELKVHSNISNVVKLLQEKVSVLENNTSSYIITQNRLQLASTYAADSVTFKVDYASAFDNRSVDGYNPDLYNLILSNILVGKDNYNYNKMFSIILDYASWDQISWEQFDELVLLMDIQHNPPIEIPEEDYTEEEIPEI